MLSLKTGKERIVIIENYPLKTKQREIQNINVNRTCRPTANTWHMAYFSNDQDTLVTTGF